MKKVLALILALVLVLSLAACQSEEDLEKEKEAVESALQGGWGKTTTGEKDYLQFYQVFLFENGKVYFRSQNVAVSSITHDDEGTYVVYPESKEIVCTVTDENKDTYGTQRKFTYKYESSKLRLFDNDGNELKRIDLN